MAGAPRVRAFGRDRIRAKGIMASGTCESRMEGRTHGRTNQPIAAASKTPCQRRAVHTRPTSDLGLRQTRTGVGGYSRVTKGNEGASYSGLRHEPRSDRKRPRGVGETQKAATLIDRPSRSKTPDFALGKGEVESSILSRSTILRPCLHSLLSPAAAKRVLPLNAEPARTCGYYGTLLTRESGFTCGPGTRPVL